MRTNLITILLFSAAGALAQPFIYTKGVVNTASVMAPDLPGGRIAQGSIFSIYGTGLGPVTGAQVSQYPLQATFQNVAVKVFQGRTSVDALPIYVSAAQINAVMPSNAPQGRVSVQVSYSGQTSNPAPVTVVPASFGIFAVNGGGFGPAVVQNFISAASQPINSLSQAAAPGQVEVLWGTGLGALTAPDNQAPPAGSLPVQVEVFVGGKPAGVAYSGRTPCCSGVDQIVFTTPADAPLGCFVPVQVRVAGQVVSNAVTMAIQTGGAACSDANNPLEQKFISGGNLGAVFAARISGVLDQFVAQPVNLLMDSFTATLWRETGGAFVFNPAYALPPQGSCSVYTVAGDLLNDTGLPGGSLPTGRALEGGSPLRISGAGGNASIPFNTPWYSQIVGSNIPGTAAPNPFFNSGNFSVTSPGGANVAGIQASVAASAPVSWTNQSQLARVNRAQALTFTWQGGDPQHETVLLTGVSSDTPTHSSAAFICAASPSAGSFTVPAYVLANLPATRTTEPLPRAWLLLGSIPINGAGAFSANGLDAGFSLFGSWLAKSVAFQ